ncbi:MAG: pirin family protein [Bdellovibrionales bacterium]|nr:pirin family protein [Bdellovibrionales bacterium]
MSKIKFSKILNRQKHQITDGFSAYDFRYSDFDPETDPIISLTHFFMSEPTFPPHPHAGFSAITYMLEHSKNGFNNRDSLGDVSKINPGDLHWTMAGRGIMHEEVPQIRGVPAEGFQIFINLKKTNKSLPARAFHVSREEAPVFKGPQIQVKVVSGVYENMNAVIQAPETPQILDVFVGGAANFQILPRRNGLIYVYQGSIQTDEFGLLGQNQAIAWNNDGAETHLRFTESTNGKFVLLSGEPTGEPIVSRGPFIMNDLESLKDAERRFRSGEMGRLV